MMIILHKAILKITFLTLLLSSFLVFSQENTHSSTETINKDRREILEEPNEELDITDMIMHHISDAHDFHITDWNGHAISMSLPIILWTNNGLVTFMSSAFHHDDEGKVVVEKNGMRFVNFHGQIYYTNSEGGITLNEKGHIENTRPLDFSITKNVFTLFLGALLLLLIFIPMGCSYAKRGGRAPKGVAAFLEPIVVFVRDDIAIPNIGEEKYAKYMPYLLTVFFFIWFVNLFGLIPFFPFSGTLTNDIIFTGFLAFLTLMITVFSGNKNYWKHIFATPGVPVWLAPIMIPVELLGVLTKPFALMVRLFANITAGHIIILSLISLIFIFETIWVSPISIAFTLFISVLELLVAVLQAYVFTLLSALFIGQAVEEAHH